MKIDIYAVPPKDDPKALLEYQIAVMTAAKEGKTIEGRVSDSHRVWDVFSRRPKWNWVEYEYRVVPKHKPAPVTKKAALTVADFAGQPTIWITHESLASEYLVVALSPDGLTTVQDPRIYTASFAALKFDDFQYSFDRKTWHPFYKEVEA